MLTRSIGGARNDGEQNRILIVKGEIAWFGVPPDCLLVKEPVRVLSENPFVLPFQIGPHVAHYGDSLTLWPAMRHESQSSQKRESFVRREPNLNAASRRFGAEKSVVGPTFARGLLTGAIGLEQALELCAQS